MQTSTIKFSQIEDRIDAEYYKPGYLYLENILNKSFNFKTLREISTKIVDGPFGSDLLKSEYIKDGIPLLRVKNISGEGIDINDIVFITHEKQKELQRSKVVAGDLVITKAGRVGTVDIVPSSIPEANITSHLAKISLKKEYNPYFIYMYLNSRLGLLQIERQGIKSTKPELNIDEVAITKIIIPSQSFQQKIEKMVKEAQENKRLADEKYKEAEEILNKELGLGDLDLSTQKTFEAKFSEAEDRFDPEYYQPKYKKIILKRKSQKSKLLGEIVKIRKGIEVGHEAYTIDGKPFIRVQDYNEKELIVSGSTNYIRPYLYEELKKNHKPATGEIIYSKDGTVGRAFVIEKDNSEFIVSGGILILILRDVDNYYLALVLNSEIVRSQAARKSIGAIIQHLSIDEVKKLQIPILPQSLQQKISSLIQQSFQLRKESKELIDRAKKEVEEMVENK
jgi:restriction endonuclease S subunit